MYNALDVCRYIMEYAHKNKYYISNLKLQKLLYFIQAYFLISKNEKCFREDIEAWDFGPVIPVAYKEYLEYGSTNIPNLKSYKKLEYDKKKDKVEFVTKTIDLIIRDEDKIMINDVLDKFKDYSSVDLTNISVNQKPWLSTYTEDEYKIISTDLIKEYFMDEGEK